MLGKVDSANNISVVQFHDHSSFVHEALLIGAEGVHTWSLELLDDQTLAIHLHTVKDSGGIGRVIDKETP